MSALEKNDIHIVLKVLNQRKSKYVLKMKERDDFEKRLFRCV